MSAIIYKYAMTPTAGGGQIFNVPSGAVFRSVAAQGADIAIWLEVPDTSAPSETRWFRSYVTGQLIEEGGLTYLGTVLFDGGSFVAHVYEQPYVLGGKA